MGGARHRPRVDHDHLVAAQGRRPRMP
jgi:hypothetical protein